MPLLEYAGAFDAVRPSQSEGCRRGAVPGLGLSAAAAPGSSVTPAKEGLTRWGMVRQQTLRYRDSGHSPAVSFTFRSRKLGCPGPGRYL